MSSPLDAFPSESSADAPTRHAMVLPRDVRPAFRRTRRQTRINRIRRKTIDAIDWVADTVAAVASLVPRLFRWTVSVRWRRLRRPVWATNDRVAVIVTAAFTSAAVTQFTLWMASRQAPHAVEAQAVEVSAPLARSETPLAQALPTGRMPLFLGRAAAPVAPQPPPALTPAPVSADTPPAVASLRPLLAQDYAVSQEAMLLEDRPVLMDARMPVGTTGSAPARPAPVASLTRDRDRPAIAANLRETARESTVPARPAAAAAIARPSAATPVARPVVATPVARNAAVTPGPRPAAATPVARPAAAAPAGLVVITQPEGARVTINGVGWGMTPLTIGHLPPGAKRVRVTKQGYRSEERVVGADAESADATLRIALREVAEDRPQQ